MRNRGRGRNRSGRGKRRCPLRGQILWARSAQARLTYRPYQVLRVRPTTSPDLPLVRAEPSWLGERVRPFDVPEAGRAGEQFSLDGVPAYSRGMLRRNREDLRFFRRGAVLGMASPQRSLGLAVACSAAALLGGCRKHETRTLGEAPWRVELKAEDGRNPSAKVEALAIDLAGNTIVAGTFNGALRIGPHEIRSDLASDGFAVKLAPDGSVTWMVRPGLLVLCPRALAIDGEGNAVLVSSAPQPGADEAPHERSFNVAKLRASDGAPIWHMLDPDGSLSVVAASDRGEACVAGLRPASGAKATLGALKNAHPDIVRAFLSAKDIHLACYGGDAVRRWSHTLVNSVPGEPAVTDLSFLSSGDVAVAGTFDQGVDAGGEILSHSARSSSGREGFVTVYSASGQLHWAKVLEGEQRRRHPPLLARSHSGVAVLYSALTSDNVAGDGREHDYRFAEFTDDGTPVGDFSLNTDSLESGYAAFTPGASGKFFLLTTGSRPALWELSEQRRGGRAIPLATTAPFSVANAAATPRGDAVISEIAHLDPSMTHFQSAVSRMVLPQKE